MTYEYTCKGCEYKWEEEQSIKDKAKTECPKCKKHLAIRLISKSGGFILNGGGWAASGYSSK
jgi:putative FmdB family regulatory protein